MTDAPPKPKRKRWRLIIAGVLLFVAVIACLYWPRGDARFVGKWRVQMNGGPREITWQFNSIGDGSSHIASDHSTFIWRVDGQRLIIGHTVRDWLFSIQRKLGIPLSLLMGKHFARIEEPYEILEVTPDAIRLRNESDTNFRGREIKLRRIPE